VLRRFIFCLIISLFSTSLLLQSGVSALSDEQKNVYQKGIYYYDVEDCTITDEEGATTLDGSGNQEKVWNFFAQKGLNAIQISGIMGNMSQESDLIQKIFKTPQVEPKTQAALALVGA
jgi:Phage tail lysozyme